MLKEANCEGLNPEDRVFEKGKDRVKVRLRAEPVRQGNKIFGPAAFRLHLSAAVCDENGKAIPRADGAFCIFPHTVTLAGLEHVNGPADPLADITAILEELIDKALAWHRGVEGVDRFLSEWQARKALPKKFEGPSRKPAPRKA